MPEVSSLDSWRDGKIKMMEIYAEAIDCRWITSARVFLDNVFAYIKKYSSSKQEWLSISSSVEHRQSLSAMRQEHATNRLCHSPGGNDYVCYCDEIEIKH